MRLVISEKPYVTRILKKMGVIDKGCDTIHTFGHGLWEEEDPNIRFNDIPFTEEPNNFIAKKFYKTTLLFTSEPKGEIKYPVENATQKEIQSTVDESFAYLSGRSHLYDEVVCFVDNDRIGVGAAEHIIKRINLDPKTPVYRPPIISFSEQHLQDAFNQRKNYLWDKNAAESQFVREWCLGNTFSYWWKYNARLVFSEACKKSGMDATATMCPFELMLTIKISASEKPVSVDEMFGFIQNLTRQSGVYLPIEISVYESIIKRGGVIQSDGGVTTAHEGKNIKLPMKRFTLSKEGQQFIRLLHPKTKDPYLAERINKWVVNNDMTSMKKYIRTFFGRQLRYQRKILQ